MHKIILLGLLALGPFALASAQDPCDHPFPDSCQFPITCCAIQGDCPWNWNGWDVTILVSYFKGGPPPTIFSKYDVNCNCVFNGADIVYFVNFLRGRGPAPICCFYICREHLQTAVIGDRVWVDADSNGIQDSGEGGLGDITVKLIDFGGTTPETLATVLTDANGQYAFDSLYEGIYRVLVTRPDGYSFSPRNQGTNDSLDSDVFPETGLTGVIALTEAEVDMTLDAGLFARETPPDTGCTRSKGFWKNHCGFGPQPDLVTPLLPLWLGTSGGSVSILVDSAGIAFDILSQRTHGEPSNGITRLCATLLTAELNIASGADDADIEDIIGDADAFLAVHSWEDWDELTQEQRQMIQQWRAAIASYNYGEIGPGECDDDEDDRE